MNKLNPTDKVFSGYYCPNCLDNCTGYKRFAGTLICNECESDMVLGADPSEWTIIAEKEALRANGDRVIILEDEFRSGYECKACNGKGHTQVKCKHCKGTGLYKGRESEGRCPDCEVGTSDGRKSFGYELCDVCKGRQATVIVPDSSKRSALTGRVISAGKEVTEFNVGDRVMYTNYTGTDFTVAGVKLRIMRQQDVLCQHKMLQQSATPDSGEINKELSEVGISVGRN